MNLEINWTNQQPQKFKIKSFLKHHGVSRRLLTAVRHHGGRLLLNGRNCRKIDCISPGDQLTLGLPAEHSPNLQPSFVPIEVCYEDRDYLVINKPARVASIPSPLHPNDSLVNRIWGYYQIRQYQNIIPHIVTRLDRDTSGLVLIAKHRFAHALLNDSLKVKVQKDYAAILMGKIHRSHLLIALPLTRDPNSLIKRQVAENDGQTAVTELWLEQNFAQVAFCHLRLHTGRTHQIRVHCAYLGHPLIGDTLYGGKINQVVQRQALHCYHLKFRQPLSNKLIEITCQLPKDMKKYLLEQG
nr:RluA family pseudouridine synthase [Liquorilactobacillus sicerae]